MLLAGALAVLLFGPAVVPARAWADDVAAAQTALNDAEARMAQIKAEYAALETQIADLQVQIDEAVESVMQAQANVQEGRARLGTMCVQDYKQGGISMFDVLLNSNNIGELVDNLHYLGVVQQAQAEEIDLQKQREDEFNEALDGMNAKKDEQMKALDEAANKSAEAEQVVANATVQLKNAQDAAAEAARLAALKAEAERLAATQRASATQSSPEVQPSGDGSGGNAPAAPETGGNSGGNANQGGSGGGDVSAGWKTGTASAYGAKEDGTLGGTTATGATVTESSMGVAVPMSWPNYRSYFGRTVEISYGGMTVFAVVNDCGGMGGGSRHLDLQPGVWRALGASSCYDWGLRTVSYRFL